MNNGIKFIDGVVVPSETDPNKGGAVRVKLIGYTDSFKDADQPWAYPSSKSINKVPRPGTYVKIVMLNPDDHSFLQYIDQGVSLATYMPEEYIDDYPNKTVSDLGIFIVYDENGNILEERDVTTSYTRRVTADGKTVIEFQRGYSFIDKQQADNSRVVTEDSVNLCTGRPINQGSIYLKVPTFESEELEAPGGTAGQI